VAATAVQSTDDYTTFCRGGLDDPYPFYDRLRSEDPVHWSDILKGWVLTRHADVVFGLRDARLSAKRTHLWMQSIPSELREQMKPLGRRIAAQLIHLDPPDHTRLRRLVNKAFTPKSVEDLRPRIQASVNELLDRLAPRGEMEMIADFAYQLPATVISDMIGIPPGDRDQFRKWSGDLMDFHGATSLTIPDLVGQASRSMEALTRYFVERIQMLRREPDGSLLSALVAVEEQGDMLSEEELVGICNLLFVAGHETTMNLIANGTLLLLRHPDQLQMLRDAPDLIASAVEEVLRHESPVKRQSRLALEDVEIGGKLVREGQYVMNMLPAANRDPARFPDPARFDISRTDNRHVAFGSGIHFCLGAFLARVEGQIALGTLFDRFPALRLASDRLEWRENMAIRGLKALPLAF